MNKNMAGILSAAAVLTMLAVLARPTSWVNVMVKQKPTLSR